MSEVSITVIYAFIHMKAKLVLILWENWYVIEKKIKLKTCR